MDGNEQAGSSLILWSCRSPSRIRAASREAFRTLNPVPPHKIQGGGLQGVVMPGKGDVVLVMGKGALDRVREPLGLSRSAGLNSMRQRAVEHDGGWFMFTRDPDDCQMFDDAAFETRADIRLADRLLRTGTIEPVVGHYSWADDFTGILDRIDRRPGRKVDVALDLETMGFYPWYEDKNILTCSITLEEGEATVVRMKDDPAIREGLKEILTSDRVRLKGANLKYDLLWIRVKYGIVCTNFTMDTMLAGSLIDENRSNSLASHALEYTDMGGYDIGFNRKYDKSRMETVPEDDLLAYAGGDTDATMRVANRMKDILKTERGLQHFYVRLLHPAARAFEAVEYNGIHVDQTEFDRLRKELVEYVDSREDAMIGMLSPRLRTRMADVIRQKKKEGKSPFIARVLKEHLFGEKGVSRNRWGLGIRPLMFTGKTGEPSTAYSHLMMFLGHPEAGEFISMLREVTRARKTLSTYVDGFLSHLRPDGKLHPTYFLFKGDQFEDGKVAGGTNTGRASVKNPAFQTIPQHTMWSKKIKRCYPAPPGYRMFMVDYSQGELKLVACVADEKRMIQVYREGLDLHCMTAAGLKGMTYGEFLALGEDHPDYKDYRFRAKAVNFGLLYGMFPKGLVEYARVAFGVDITLGEATSYREAFFGTYPGLERWHETSRQTARRHGFVVSPLGRVRHLPLINSDDYMARGKSERRAINAPIQSMLSDMCLWTIALLHEKYGNEEIRVMGMVHDSIYGYVPEKSSHEWLKRITMVMETLPFEKEFGWKPQLVFTADAEIGPNMGDMEKVVLS